MILSLVDEAVQAGARQEKACDVLTIRSRTLQRWRLAGVGDDGRQGPKSALNNKLSEDERQKILALVNTPEHRDLTPHQIVPRLADQGTYIASESTIYRLLREAKQLAHRGRTRPAAHHRPQERIATGPNQVWSWDITYLRGPVRGEFFYLYLFMDIWSRKIVAAWVYPTESDDSAAELFLLTCAEMNLDPTGIVLHSDNGSPMKGATMLATLQNLGVVTSFSRPRVSDDNPFSEALFRTLKYRPEYPGTGFASLDAANIWVKGFVHWYNTVHQHSAIRFVTPEDRHGGRDVAILARREEVYKQAQCRHPERWSGETRDWTPVEAVCLNPAKSKPRSQGDNTAEPSFPVQQSPQTTARETVPDAECGSSRLTEKGWPCNSCPSAPPSTRFTENVRPAHLTEVPKSA